MPIYEYRCRSCGNTFEVIQKFSDAPLRKCTECSGRLEKLISRTSFQLRGGGWFAQDYTGSKPDKPAASKDSGGEKKKTESSGSGGSGSCGGGSCGCA